MILLTLIGLHLHVVIRIDTHDCKIKLVVRKSLQKTPKLTQTNVQPDFKAISGDCNPMHRTRGLEHKVLSLMSHPMLPQNKKF